LPIRPNHRARHARALRADIEIPSVFDTFRKMRWFTLGLIFVLPLYPSLSWLGSGGVARAGNYDNSTIITAYTDYGDGGSYISDTGLVRVGGSSGESRPTGVSIASTSGSS
jgi:hypothetical protein